MGTERQQRQYQVRLGSAADHEYLLAEDLDVLVVASALETPVRLAHIQLPQVHAGFRNRTAVARWVLQFQAAKADRCVVGIVLTAQVGFSAPDFLVAGAIVDSLAEIGIDYCSPEAAVACASFQKLRNSIAHLLTASVDGRKFADTRNLAALEKAGELDDLDEVQFLLE